MAPRPSSILRTERVMGPIDFFGCEKLQRQGGILKISGRENFSELIVTVMAYDRNCISFAAPIDRNLPK